MNDPVLLTKDIEVYDPNRNKERAKFAYLLLKGQISQKHDCPLLKLPLMNLTL